MSRHYSQDAYTYATLRTLGQVPKYRTVVQIRGQENISTQPNYHHPSYQSGSYSSDFPETVRSRFKPRRENGSQLQFGGSNNHGKSVVISGQGERNVRSPIFDGSPWSNSNSMIGNGFRTLPSNLNRGVRAPDPLMKVNRFKKQTSRSDMGYVSDGEGLNNFDYYKRIQSKSTSSLAQPKDSSGSSPGNKPSLLLTNDENRYIFGLLGSGRQTLATAVGRLLLPSSNHRRWKVKVSTGVVCLIWDSTENSHFIEVYSTRARSPIFQQEIYTQFDYQMHRRTFMTFEGDNSMVGIVFADSQEARDFQGVLDSKLESGKRYKRNESRQMTDYRSQVYIGPSTPLLRHNPYVDYVSTSMPSSPSYSNAYTKFSTVSSTSTFTDRSKRKSQRKTKDTSAVETPTLSRIRPGKWPPTSA